MLAKGTMNGEGLSKLIFIRSAASGIVGTIIYGAWQMTFRLQKTILKSWPNKDPYLKTIFRLQKTILSSNKDSTILRSSTKKITRILRTSPNKVTTTSRNFLKNSRNRMPRIAVGYIDCPEPPLATNWMRFMSEDSSITNTKSINQSQDTAVAIAHDV